MTMNIKRLSLALIVTVIILHFASEAWYWLGEFVYEPAGNPWQVFVLDVAPLWLRRIFYPVVNRFISPPYALFWLGIVMWFMGREANDNQT
jgi:hypothetical protein